MWSYRGEQRPAFAKQPGPGQESVWDYPRPPALVADARHITIAWQQIRVVDTRRAFRVLETASPPTFYFPPADVNQALLQAARGSSFCEWKGEARYWNLVGARDTLEAVAWSYSSPTPAFAAIAGWLAFYPHQLDCRVDQQPVRPQGGAYYGGWVTREIVGPWKGDPGTGSW